MTAYYNEHDAYAAQWLRNLIAAGHIAPGVVDERSIEDVCPDDLRGFTQCHFFAGLGGWSRALRCAGWPDDRPVWTMSCPCQPFSAAGEGVGFADERHLWPPAYHLATQLEPSVIFGEQVASKAANAWIDLVHADLEALGYAVGAIAFPSAGVGAPHVRDRLYWLADSDSIARRQGGSQYDWGNTRSHAQPWTGLGGSGLLIQLGDPYHSGLEIGRNGLDQLAGSQGREAAQRFAGLPSFSGGAGPVNGRWAGADWVSCQDGKWRPLEPGLEPLADGVPSRVGRLRAYGNAINAEAATQFILAYLEQPNVIYLTSYDRITLTCTGASTDSGFTSLDEVREMMGDPDMAHPRMLTYGDSCFTDFPLSLTPAASTCNTAPNSIQVP